MFPLANLVSLAASSVYRCAEPILRPRVIVFGIFVLPHVSFFGPFSPVPMRCTLVTIWMSCLDSPVSFCTHAPTHPHYQSVIRFLFGQPVYSCLSLSFLCLSDYVCPLVPCFNNLVSAVYWLLARLRGELPTLCPFVCQFIGANPCIRDTSSIMMYAVRSTIIFFPYRSCDPRRSAYHQ